MNTVTITNVKDMGNDVLLIEGTIGETPEGEEPAILQAQGWLSATINHYDAQDYQEDGHRKEGAQSREMTDDEKQDYYQRILRAQHRLG